MSKHFSRSRISGFSLIELLIAMVIIGLLFSIGLSQYARFNRNQVVTQTAENLKSDLRLIQSKALAGEMPSACEPGSSLEYYRAGFSLYGYSLEARCGVSIVIKNAFLPPGVQIDASQSEITFNASGLGTGLSETITIRVSGESDFYKEIIVAPSGEIK